MKNIVVVFSGNQYHLPTGRTVEQAPQLGADEVRVYDDYWLRTLRPQHWIDTQHLWTLPSPQGRTAQGRVPGVNWFAWKPFVILDALERCNPDDVILYLDADTYPVHDIRICFDIARRDTRMVFKCVAQYHKWWCKRSCFESMNIPCDPSGVPLEHDRYYDAPIPHGCARFMALTPTEENKAFLREWYRYCLSLDCNTFHASHERFGPENPELKEHRCEQAIMTNLFLRNGWKMWREACQFGNSVDDDKDVFPQLFFQDGSHSFGPNEFAPGSAYRNVVS